MSDEAEAPERCRKPAAGEPEEVERLKAELAGRDETILLLLDELSRVEEAQAASRAEWEQLTGWVAELEHRVEGQDGDAVHRLENELADQQQKSRRAPDEVRAGSPRLGGQAADLIRRRSPGSRRRWIRLAASREAADGTDEPRPAGRGRRRRA